MTTPRLPRSERQLQIADAALRILAVEGATRLTAKHIGEALGVSDAAVFRHFPDKRAVLDAAIRRFEELLDDAPLAGGVPPLERLRGFFVHRVTRVRANPDVLGLTFNDRLQEVAGEDGAARVKRVIKRSMATVRKALREAQREGALRDDIPPDVMVWMFQGVMRGAARSQSPTQARRDPDAIFDDLIRALEPRA